MAVSRLCSFWPCAMSSALRPSTMEAACTWELRMLWNSPGQDANNASAAARVSLAELPCA
eukprot:10143957-Alexandrium_andersonii.AAC.1